MKKMELTMLTKLTKLKNQTKLKELMELTRITKPIIFHIKDLNQLTDPTFLEMNTT